jgi:hypothetical protein
MGWGLVWAWRNDPQPLTYESRNLLITVLIESGLIFALVQAQEYFVADKVDPNISLGVLLLMIGTCLFYIPDGQRWASQREGLWSLFGELPVVLGALIVIRLLISYEGTSLTVGVLIVLVTIYVLYKVVETYIK